LISYWRFITAHLEGLRPLINLSGRALLIGLPGWSVVKCMKVRRKFGSKKTFSIRVELAILTS
jgi:hypothetical protein